MKKTYTVTLRKAYHAAKRTVFAYGKIINFIDGIAGNVSEAVALELMRRKLITEMRPEFVLEQIDNTEASLSSLTPELKIIEMHDVNPAEVEQPEFTEAELEAMVEPEEETVLPEEPVADEETVLPEEPVADEDSVVEEEPMSEEEPEEEETSPSTEDEITKERIESLYAELGTWSAVAEALNITTSKLKKYRDEFGL